MFKKGVADRSWDELKKYYGVGVVVRTIEKDKVVDLPKTLKDIYPFPVPFEELVNLVKNKFPNSGDTFAKSVAGVVASSVFPNLSFNETLTKVEINRALKGIQPVKRVIKEGEVIVRRGDVISDSDYQKLVAYAKQSGGRGIKYIIGSLFALAVTLTVILLVLSEWMKGKIWKIRDSLVVSSQIFMAEVLFYAASIFSRDLSAPVFLIMPFSSIAFSLSIMLGWRESLITAMSSSFLLFFYSPSDFVSFIAVMVVGVVAVFGTKSVVKRTDFFKSSLLVLAVNLFMSLVYVLVYSVNASEITRFAMFSFLNSFVSVAVAMGVLPIYEYLLRVPTVFRLQELSNLNNPIFRELLVRAPGTYHHSVLVGNMAEVAAQEIGANPFLARVGGYIHDIGKMQNPDLFAENQINGVNKHQNIKPTLSVAIIKAHVKNGVEMAKRLRVPDEVIDIIQQHHGTTLVKYFYNQALTLASGGVVDKEDFRYPGPKPQSKEAAIVMLADTVEAAVRSLKKITPKRVEEVVGDMIRQRLMEGELDESPLTLKDLSKIGRMFIKSLQGYAHYRPAYPTEAEIKDREQKKYGADVESEKQQQDTSARFTAG